MNNGMVFNNPLVYIKNCKTDIKYEGMENSYDILEEIEIGWRRPPPDHTTSTTCAPDSAFTALRPHPDSILFSHHCPTSLLQFLLLPPV